VHSRCARRGASMSVLVLVLVLVPTGVRRVFMANRL
jgi:hypothetical protein